MHAALHPILLSILSFATACTAQEMDCSVCRTGTYTEEIEPDIITTYVRSTDQQIESTPGFGARSSYTVRWTGPCTYQLFDRIILEGDTIRPLHPTDTLTIRITKVDSAGFDYIASANFAPMELPGRQTVVMDRR